MNGLQFLPAPASSSSCAEETQRRRKIVTRRIANCARSCLGQGKMKSIQVSFTRFTHTKATKVQMHEPLRSTSSRIVSFKPRENMAQAWLAQALSRTQNALATARNKRRWPQEIYLERVGIIACCQRLGGSAYTCQQKYFARRMSDEGTVLHCMCFQDKLSIWKLRCQTLAVHGRMKVYAHLLCDMTSCEHSAGFFLEKGWANNMST